MISGEFRGAVGVALAMGVRDYNTGARIVSGMNGAQPPPPPPRWGRAAPGLRSLPAEGETHADVGGAPQSGITQHALVVLVEEVVNPRDEGGLRAEAETAGHVEHRVPRIARKAERREEEIAVRPPADESSGQRSTKAPEPGAEH